MTIEEKRRELFEAWYLLKYYEGSRQCGLDWLVREPCGGYRFDHPARHWETFNAALDAVEIEFPESCAWESLDSAMQFVFLTYEAGETGPDSVELCRRNDCIKAIESTGLGLKVKS